MDFVYKPEGMTEPKIRFPWKPGKMLNVEAEIIERKTGMTFAEWEGAVRAGSMLATRGLLYVLLKRQEPTTTWESVQFTSDEVDFEVDDEELPAIVEAMREARRQDALTSDQLALLERLEAQIEAEAAEKAETKASDPEFDPDAPEPLDPTGSPSSEG